MIYIGSDHRGYKIKEAIKEYLDKTQLDYIDCGTDTEDRTDYPDFAKKVAENVQKDINNRGILICGTGIGMCIVANKFKGIRCALCYNKETAKYARLHNNSNILALCANDNTVEENLEIFKAWISTNFEGDRHQKRLNIIQKIESENFK